MSNLYRGPSIDASYQVSVHIAEGFQRRRLKCENLTDDRRRTTDAMWWQGEIKRHPEKNLWCHQKYCQEQCMKIPISRFLGKVKNTRESDMVIGTSHRESNMSVAHTCQPLKPSMREISPSAMTAEGEILHKWHFQPKYMTCTLYIYKTPIKVNKYTLFLQFIVIIYTSCFCLFQYLWVRTILITFHIFILFGTNKWAYSVICQFWPMFSLNFF